jgi:1-acyl-sn-glycerol-3-phosphate acyltransferase
MPPALIRRPLTITTWVVLAVLCLLLSPLLLTLAALASGILRQPQPLLLTRLVISYFAHELGALAACGAIWLLSGFGLRMRTPRFRQLHYRVLYWFVRGLASRVIELLDLEIAPEIPPEVAAALKRDRPLLFFSRHAGPADSLLLVDLLLSRCDRLPSVVFKDTLAIDPTVDLIGHRLPHAVLDTSDRDEAEEAIKDVAANLDPRGILVLFPEGGNFTVERRRRALRRLWRKGKQRHARAAQQMEHVMPPHPMGAVAALQANPEADVIFGAHTGLGLAAFPGEMWRHPPFGCTLTEHMWIAPASERPRDPERQVDWLFDWWRRLDRWVEGQGEQPSPESEAEAISPEG